jgi:hypothetical protein
MLVVELQTSILFILLFCMLVSELLKEVCHHMANEPISTLTTQKLFDNPMSREEAIELLQASAETYGKFLKFPREVQDNLIDFITGQKCITINYDPFFKKIFDPLAHPNRLEKLISAILRFEVTIESVLPHEGVRLSADSSFVIMDVVVTLDNGTYVSVEIQKIGYNFPGGTHRVLFVRPYTTSI